MLVRVQLVGGGNVAGDQAGAKELRKSLLRKTALESTSSVTEEDEDTLAGVCTIS